MGKIIILDESTANKIAAGEVIERPASVVKELIENSIDAGASVIKVEIAKGGISLIRVTDNASGIEEDDVRLAFDRHATSKLKSPNGLASISTLGFRGEALSSIASVSKVTMLTKTRASGYGTQIVLEGGKVKDTGRTGCSKGTSVTVRELFYNTPARYKFLKKNSTETRYVTEVVNRIALGNPHVSVRYFSDSTEMLHTPGNNDLLSTIFCVYGKNTADNCIKLEGENGPMKVNGFIGKPSISRSNRSAQSFFINGRFVKSSLLSSAVDEAYKTFVMKNKYPFVVINVDTGYELVDVNVHPTKLNVRFFDEQEVFRLIFHATKNALLNASAIEKIDIRGNSQNLHEEGSMYSKSYFSGNKEKNRDPGYVQKGMDISGRTHGEQEAAATDDREQDSSSETQQTDDRSILKEAVTIGQVFKTYLLLQYDNTMYIVDQHAAHEKVVYEKLIKEYASRKTMSQSLLSPVVIELSSSEILYMEENRQLFESIGYIYEPFGNNSIMMRAVPYVASKGDIRREFMLLLGHIMESNTGSIDVLAREALYKLACTNAIKAGKSMDKLESGQLLKEMSELENPFTCPHGRPTVVKIEKDELEKKFKRK